MLGSPIFVWKVGLSTGLPSGSDATVHPHLASASNGGRMPVSRRGGTAAGMVADHLKAVLAALLADEVLYELAAIR